MNLDDWPAWMTPLAAMATDEAAAKLWEIGENDLADEILAEPPGVSRTYGELPWRSGKPTRAFMSTHHAIGYLPPVGTRTHLTQIWPAETVAPDATLRTARVKVTIDKLHIADYPGGGTHRILLNCGVRSQASKQPDWLWFNMTCEARDGGDAPIAAWPVFTGIPVGPEGMQMQLNTINVCNKEDEKLLKLLNSDAFKGGLQLLAAAQPAVAPLSALAVGLAEITLQRNQNQGVQQMNIGLDFSANATRPRLAEGSYIVLQQANRGNPSSWDDLTYDPANGHIVSRREPGQSVPCNYIIISVSRYQGK
ncbi:MAG: hypothetical protein JO242_00450 [Streptosporangiaceae bacterium]|nr:hypothetical protein [Streptosporangiaceae bacterium]